MKDLFLVAFACVLATGIRAQLQRTEKIFITAPNIFRVGVNETVTVAVFDTSEDVSVTVYLEKRQRGLSLPYSTSTVTVQRGFPVTTMVRVEAEHLLPADDEGDQYVFLVASSPSLDFREEKEILVSSTAGYLLLQTDKPIYTPNQEVKIRVVAVDQEMKPSSELIHLQVLNPQGIVVRQFLETRAVNGFLDKTFRFDTEPMFGNWSVTVLHGLQFQRNKTVKFEVKEYVLPRFAIQINTPDYILRGSDYIEINFEAKYVYKKPVQGVFHFTIGVLQTDGNVVSVTEYPDPGFPGLLVNGIGAYRLLPIHVFGQNWFDMYEGCKLIVEVTVTEQSTGVTEKAVDTSTPFVTSPYRFKPGETVRYFKKGLPYELQYELVTVTGLPAQHVAVNIEAHARTARGTFRLYNIESDGHQEVTDINGRVRFTLNTTQDVYQIDVRASAGPQEDQEAVFHFSADPYESPAENNGLSMHIDQNVLRMGDEVHIIVYTTGHGPISNLNLLFLAQGKVVLAKSIDHVISSPERVFFRVTADMVPTVRVIAYYINESLVVADSVWLKIENTCKYHVGLNIEEPANEDGSYLPDSPVTLLVDAHPMSYVGLLGVDNAVYALNKQHRLTRKKVAAIPERMFEMMQSYDVGCGPGGGRTSAVIFKDAGVTVLTNAELAVPAREALSCPSPSSRKRRNAIAVEDSLQDKLSSCLASLQDTCEDNLTTQRMTKKISRWVTCEKISSKLKVHCVSATSEDLMLFKECCMATNTASFRTAPIQQGRIADVGEEEPPELEVDLAAPLRTDFHETWLFDLVRIGAMGRESVALTTPSSITEWSLQAVSVTPRGGLCITEPLGVNVFKSLTIQLQLPYSVVHLEQIEILATIYNYNARGTTVDVAFYNPRGTCGEAANAVEPSRRRVSVEGNSSQSLKFIIVPLETGEVPIIVTATSDLGIDGVRKTLKVIPQGTPLSVDHSVVLDPSGMYRHHRRTPRMRAAILDDIQSDQVVDADNGVQFNVLDLRLPEDIIPDTESAVVTLLGSMLGPILVDPIENFGQWLQLPRGCGEQTMSIVAPTIFVLKYLQSLKLTNATLEDQALDRISSGLASALVHRREDGSFAIWGNSDSYNSSTWLTSFALKIFSHADEITTVDKTVMCKAAEWLVGSCQQPDGSFSEVYKVHHKEMTGGVSGEASMTAYVLISLLEGHWCDGQQQNLDLAIQRAKVFLEQQVRHLTRPYAKAIVTYALALAKSDYAADANRMLRNDAISNTGDGSRHWTPATSDLTNEDMPYWYRERPSAIAVETTAYALLAQLVLGEITYAGSVALWLSEQQNYNGGFVSTQDSVIALQALIKYTDMASNGDDIDLTCILTSEVDSTFRFEHHLLPHNALVQHEINVPVGGRLRSECSGKGTGKLSVKMQFNRASNAAEICPFEVTLDAQEARTGFTTDLGTSRSRVGIIRRSTTTAAQMARTKGDLVTEISFCARYIQNTRTNMGIIDVGLYSGFVLVEDRLEEMVHRDHLDLVQRFEVSQRSVIFYLDRIPADQMICIRFHARRELHVGNVQPVPIRVYDYYSPDKSCTTFYHPVKDSPLIQKLCNDDNDCICPSERCSMCDRQSLKDLENLACASDDHYALKVIMESQEHTDGYVVYTGNVTAVLKAGVDDVSVGSLRQFYIKNRCDCYKIRMRNQYTIVGSAGLSYVSNAGREGYKYLLDERSMVEWWPTKTRKRKNQEAILKLQELDSSLAQSCT